MLAFCLWLIVAVCVGSEYPVGWGLLCGLAVACNEFGLLIRGLWIQVAWFRLLGLPFLYFSQ